MTCVRCDGNGEVCCECRLNENECECDGMPDLVECPVCDGEGETYVDDRICEECGEKLDPDDDFCPYCEDEDDDEDEDEDDSEETTEYFD